jgi:predicted membrane protein
LLIGAVLLVHKAGILVFPAWLISWGVLLIAIGLLSGIRNRFRGGFWAFALLFGTFLLVRDLDPGMRLERFTLPVILMSVGLIFILRPRRNRWTNCNPATSIPVNTGARQTTTVADEEPAQTDRRDFVEVTSVFGGVKKIYLSKNFKGGEVTAVMGGAEIDLSQTDFTGQARMEVTCVMGGAKLVVPSSWDVQSEITAIFGGVDDKRQISGVQMDPNKVLVLEGTALFGGIEIRSF